MLLSKQIKDDKKIIDDLNQRINTLTHELTVVNLNNKLAKNDMKLILEKSRKEAEKLKEDIANFKKYQPGAAPAMSAEMLQRNIYIHTYIYILYLYYKRILSILKYYFFRDSTLFSSSSSFCNSHLDTLPI